MAELVWSSTLAFMAGTPILPYKYGESRHSKVQSGCLWPFSSQHGSAILDAAMLRDMVPVNRMRGRSAWLISSWCRRIAVSLLGLSSRLFLCSWFLSFPDDIYSCRVFMDFERFLNELSYTLYPFWFLFFLFCNPLGQSHIFIKFYW